LARTTDYHLYLLMDVDLPWRDDPLRFFPEDRELFLDDCIQVLESNNKNYKIVRGLGEERLNCAIDYISTFSDKIFDKIVWGNSGL